MSIIPPDFSLLTTRDRHPIQCSYRQLQTRLKQNQPIDKLLEKYQINLKKSAAIVAHRKEHLPKPTKANDLPVTARWDEIAETINNNQVAIICGHTGSGKTTQIPQICLSLGLGARGKIAHTQPRRIAARTVAARIAEELDTTLGREVGYKVRFDEKHSKDTTILLQTDGMLLAEIQQDKFLNNYEVIIIDEAHERSLNIDFLLGYLRDLLPKRPDLKVIITSATIDPERFAKHFSTKGNRPLHSVLSSDEIQEIETQDSSTYQLDRRASRVAHDEVVRGDRRAVQGAEAPVVLVEGKTFPIETIYRPIADDDSEADNTDLNDAICRAVKELDDIHYGDTLVFLPTERDIRDAQEALQKLNLRHTEVLSLFARQTAALQNAIFHPKNKRRIILSTNVAETSVTVPRILNVIDTGIARISRYSHRSKIQRLPIEPISRASANQRQGRCGRIAEGVCIRLYSENDFLSRPEFTDPEIKRTSLASVILQMASIGLGEIQHFPFVEPPEHKMIADGYKLLFELQAVDKDNQITALGKTMANLPLDPRFAAVLLHAQQTGVLGRVLPIVGALVVGDIKERPFGNGQSADSAHRLFAHKQSDFLFFSNVFDVLYPLFKKSKNQARKWAKKHYLSAMRIREWLFLVEQLAEQLNDKITMPDGIMPDLSKKAADKYANEYQSIHESILVGFLDHVGSYQPEDGDYIGARNKRFHVFPGSFLFKKKVNHVVCAEIVESSRVFARQVAKIDLEWLAPLCSHLSKTSESEPMWSKKQGNVMAKQTVMLYGLPIVVGKLVPYARSHPTAAHDIFVRHGLVENAINTTLPEIAKNRGAYDKLLKLEEKSRSRDILIDGNAFAELYFKVIPNTVYSAVTLKAWYAKAEQTTREQLLFSENDFLLDADHGVDSSDYPNFFQHNNQRLPLTYEFDPASPRDGITVTVPLASLNGFSEHDFDYLVPALLPEKITALMKSLPKRYRRQFVPVAPYIDAIMATILPHVDSNSAQSSPLIEQMISVLAQQSTIKLTPDLFDVDKLDKHYLMNIAVTNKDGKIVAEKRDLLALQAEFHHAASDDFNRSTGHVFAEVFKESFPKHIAETHQIKDKKLTAYPALISTTGGYKIELFDAEDKAQSAHQRGVLDFIKQGLNKEINYIKKQVLNNPKITLAYRALTIDDTANNNLLDDMVDALLLQSYLRELPRDDKAYQTVIVSVKKTLVVEAQKLSQTVLDILTAYREARELMRPNASYFADVDSQLNRLVYAGFISATPQSPTGGRLADIARYVQGVVVRLKKAQLDPQKDSKWQAQIEPFTRKLTDKIGNKRLDKSLSPEVLAFAYLLEEYRLSVFAQGQVKVVGKVSEKRLWVHQL